MCDLLHDMEVMFHLANLLTASGNPFSNMIDARDTAICFFHGHHSCFRKDFQML